MKTPLCSRLSAFAVASVALSCAAAQSCAAPSKAETEVVKTLEAKADAAEAIAKGAAAGIVLGPDSKPITGATVAFYKSGRWQEIAAQTVTTDAAGRFSVTITAPASKAASAATEPVGRVVVVAPDLAQRGDSRLGDEFFKRVKAKLFRLSPYPDNSIRALLAPYALAPYAYYRATIDLAESRLLLESEWARRDKNSEDDNYGQSSAAPQIARAMAAVDVDRAVEMARSLSDKHRWKSDALARIIVYVLASDAQRRVMPFGENGQWE